MFKNIIQIKNLYSIHKILMIVIKQDYSHNMMIKIMKNKNTLEI